MHFLRPTGGGCVAIALLVLVVTQFHLAAETVAARGEGNDDKESPDDCHPQWEMAYTGGDDYYDELEPFIVSGVSKRLRNGQRMHGYRLAFPYQASEEENPVRSRRDTKAATKGARQGMDQNVYRQGKATAYLGVPYAEKPMRLCDGCENLAFKRPRPLNFATSNYLLNQSNNYFPDTCPQNVLGIISGSEDCLYMNIITPAMTDGDHGYATSYPVMVFFHGGSLKEGGAYNFGPLGIVQNLVRRGMIVITMQYRIGVYGFMNLGNVVAGIKNNSARGMYDQVEGLKWIQRNIGAFNGDPLKELNPPGKNPLFSRLILQSASSDSCRAGGIRSDIYKGQPRTSTSEHSGVVCPGQDTPEKYLNCLEARPIDHLLAQTNEIAYPIWDLELPDDYLRYSADAAYAASTYTSRKKKPIDILMGMTRDEFASYDANIEKRFPAISPDYHERMKQVLTYSGRNFSETDAEAFIEEALTLYRNGEKPTNDSEWYDLYVDVLTDGLVTSAILLDARRFTTLGNNVYLYKIFYAHGPFFQRPDNYNKSTHKIVPHAVELPYIFMPERMWVGTNVTGQMQTADIFGEVWFNFVKSGEIKKISGQTVAPRPFPGQIDLATGSIDGEKKKGYDLKFDYVYLNKNTIRVGDANDSIFIREGAEKFWNEWKYAQLTHYQPEALSSGHGGQSHRSAQINGTDSTQLAKKHREEPPPKHRR